MSIQLVKQPLVTAALFALVAACLPCLVWGMSQTADGDRKRIQTLATSPDIDSTWRHTKYGWQDSAGWPAADPFVPTKVVELLHPIVWTGIVLLAVIAVMVWASSEWEIARLFSEDHSTEFTSRSTGVDEDD